MPWESHHREECLAGLVVVVVEEKDNRRIYRTEREQTFLDGMLAVELDDIEVA